MHTRTYTAHTYAHKRTQFHSRLKLYLSVCQFFCLSVFLSVCLSFCLSVFLSFCLSICLSVCQTRSTAAPDIYVSRTLKCTYTYIHIHTHTYTYGCTPASRILCNTFIPSSTRPLSSYICMYMSIHVCT